MRALIIDDEADAIKSLSIMIDDYCEGLEIVGTANSALEGIKLINQVAPDLIFLDVEMPNGNGFDLLEGVASRNFQVIFTTAYAHYAIKAIKANAIDYLMKPIDIDELIQAIKNAKTRMDWNHTDRNEKLLNTLQEGELTKIPVSVKNEYIFIDLEDIQFIKSNGSYTNIHTFDECYTTAKNLKYYEKLLAGNNFLRVSNSHVINIEKVVKYLREDGGIVELRNKSQILVSRNRKEKLKQLLGI